MDSDANIGDLVETIKQGDKNKKENATVKIAKIARSGDRSVRVAVPQLKKALIAEDPPRLHWKAASALAEIAYQYPESVNGIEDRLIEIIDNKEGYWSKANAILALTAVESESSVEIFKDLYEQSNESREQVIAKIAILTVSSNYETGCDFQHIRTIVSGSVGRLEKLLMENTIATPSKDCLAALVLLTEYDNKESRICVVNTAKNQPEHFEKILPAVESEFDIHELWMRHYSLLALAEYVREDPERVTEVLWNTIDKKTVSQGIVDRISENGNVIVHKNEDLKADSQESLAINLGKPPVGVSETELLDKKLDFVHDNGEYGLLVGEELVTKKYILKQLVRRVRSDVQDCDIEIEAISQGFEVGELPTGQDSTVIEEKRIKAQASNTGNHKSEESITKLREKAEKNAVEKVPEDASITSGTRQYNRSSEVKEYVKVRAQGTCEGCGEPAPFRSKTGDPYLHAYHVYELSEGGADTPDSVIALCPNCHYRVHHGEDGEKYNEELKRKVESIENKTGNE